ncbi:hypothetical protein P3S68_014407 [Capsicum galapagoense]
MNKRRLQCWISGVGGTAAGKGKGSPVRNGKDAATDGPCTPARSGWPVAPYPGGSFVGTLAPSSSSSDLRPELVSGSSKEVFSTQASSIIATSNPVGSMFSKVLYEDGDM